jgi:phage antirepressor YoqD-like protein
MQQDVAAHERLTKADGSLNVTEAAKNLGLRPKDLFDWLSHNGWIYRRANSATWLGFQTKCNQGLMEHKTTTVLRADGSEKITEQVRITAKGLSVLAKLIHPTVRLVG